MGTDAGTGPGRPAARRALPGAAAPTGTTSARRPLPAPVVIGAVGDMMFGRGVADYMHAHGGRALLSSVAGEVAAADVAIGNLEGPLAEGGARAKGKDTTLLGDPRAVEGLKSAGFDVVGLANNHTLDYGASALSSTLTGLDRAGIRHAGAGTDETSAYRAATFVTPQGVRVAVLSYSHVVPLGFPAVRSHPGIARSRFRMDRVARDIKKARSSHDLVVIMLHWGTEYKEKPSSEQREDAHTAIDAGADLVVGHHPHVIQGIETYKGRPIAYSLGDFVFDHYSRATGESFILSARFGPGKAPVLTVTPTYLDETSGRPSVVQGTAAARILTRLQRISRPLNSDVRIHGDIATIEMPARESK